MVTYRISTALLMPDIYGDAIYKPLEVILNCTGLDVVYV